jgi:hypothetical protein
VAALPGWRPDDQAKTAEAVVIRARDLSRANEDSRLDPGKDGGLEQDARDLESERRRFRMS